MPSAPGRLGRFAVAASRALAAVFAAVVISAVVLLVPAHGAAAAPGDPTSSAIPTPGAPTPSSTASLPGFQSQAPGTPQTPPAAPQAPGEPFPWAFVVFGVVGVALLVAWAVLGRRQGGDGSDDDGDRG